MTFRESGECLMYSDQDFEMTESLCYFRNLIRSISVLQGQSSIGNGHTESQNKCLLLVFFVCTCVRVCSVCITELKGYLYRKSMYQPRITQMYETSARTPYIKKNLLHVLWEVFSMFCSAASQEQILIIQHNI